MLFSAGIFSIYILQMEHKLNRVIDSVIIGLIALYSFVYVSGWGVMLKLPEKANYIIILAGIITLIRSNDTSSPFRIPLFLGFLLITSFIYIPVVNKDSWEGATYLLAFVIVYIFSKFKVTETTIRSSAYIIAILGLIVMCVYLYGSFLDGWNDNGIAITGFFCYCYYTIYLSTKNRVSILKHFGAITVLYLITIFSTDCRSAGIFTIVMMTVITFPNIVRKIFNYRFFNIIILNLPLIIALIIINIGESSMASELDTWSQDSLEKSAFSGRDQIWDQCLDYLAASPYMGTSKFITNYHNSGIAALTTFGIIGYVAWIWLFSTILSQLKRYDHDKIVLGCISAFICIFIQQSFDLGFIASEPNLIPYVILGIGYGRIYTLHKQMQYAQCNNSRI